MSRRPVSQPTLAPPGREQLALALEPPGAPAVSEAPGARPAWYSGYTVPVLRWVGACGLAAAHTVLRRFWLYDGRHPGYGERVLARLVADGLLESRLLFPTEGQRSPRVLLLTEAGHDACGVPAPRQCPWAGLTPARELHLLRLFLCQRAELWAAREARGWRLVPVVDGYDALRGDALRVMDRPARTDAEHLWARHARLVPAPPLPPRLRVIQHRATGAARLVLPARPGLDPARLLARLPDLRVLFGPHGAGAQLTVELLASDPEEADRARRALQTWAERHRVQLAATRAAWWFLRRPHPHRAPVPAGSLYARHGVPPVLTLDAPGGGNQRWQWASEGPSV